MVCSPRLHVYCEILLQFKTTVFYFNTFLNVIHLCDGQSEFSTSLLQSSC